MRYLDLYNYLKENVHYDDEVIALEGGLTVYNFDFVSRRRFPDRAETPPAPEPESEQGGSGLRSLMESRDAEIEENNLFRYHLMLPAGQNKAARLIILLHGFNDRSWHKYLPWAACLAEKTGRGVLMFPIAFHMNRAPKLWSDNRAMHQVARGRLASHPAIIHSTLSNAAISTRLHHRPERFIWSGLQTYHDLVDLAEEIRAGRHQAVEAEAGLNFCAYSIGALLGEIVMMTDKDGLFSDSRFAAFCGGPVFNRLSPVSKFILDSEANVRLYSYLVEHLESHMKADPLLGKLLGGDYGEGINFRSLLDYRTGRVYREEKLRAVSSRVYAVALAADEVAPCYEIEGTLKGSRRDIGIRVDTLDYPYPYRHEDPFPALARIAGQVDVQFHRTFDLISEFLRDQGPLR